MFPMLRYFIFVILVIFSFQSFLVTSWAPTLPHKESERNEKQNQQYEPDVQYICNANIIVTTHFHSCACTLIGLTKLVIFGYEMVLVLLNIM